VQRTAEETAEKKNEKTLMRNVYELHGRLFLLMTLRRAQIPTAKMMAAIIRMMVTMEERIGLN
jgi:hypothetical protein